MMVNPIPEESDMALDWKTLPNGKEKYGAYLASREWALLREAVRQRCNSICEVCGVNEMQATHHLTYARIYRERLEDLEGICDDCHAHKSGRSYRPNFYKLYIVDGPRDYEECFNYFHDDQFENAKKYQYLQDNSDEGCLRYSIEMSNSYAEEFQKIWPKVSWARIAVFLGTTRFDLAPVILLPAFSNTTDGLWSLAYAMRDVGYKKLYVMSRLEIFGWQQFKV